MLSSMTGFGRAERSDPGRKITVEIKAVNHRFFECSVRSPRGLSCVEEPVRALIASRVKRGKIEAYISVECEEHPVLTCNDAYLSALLESARGISAKYRLKNDLKLSDIISVREVFAAKSAEGDTEQTVQAVLETAQEALDAFVGARDAEGARLCADIRARLEQIGKNVAVIEQRAPQTIAAYRERITARMTDLLGSAGIDEARILTEAAIYSDRITTAEETTRLKTHIGNFSALLDGSGPTGKKLDFYMQEMNREINTVGSKCADIEVSGIVIEVKNELENIREQIQNIE